MLRYGTEEQRLAFLPGIARGEVLLLHRHERAGFGLRSRLDPHPRGQRSQGGYEVTGAKVWTSYAHRVALRDHARAHRRRREETAIAVSRQLIVDLKIAGRHDPADHQPRRRASISTRSCSTDVFVPDDRLVGEEGNGWRQVTSELAFERSGPDRFLVLVPAAASR